MNDRFSRRDLLKGMGVGTLGLSVFSLGTGIVAAQTTPTLNPLGAVFHSKLGDWDVMVIKDFNFNLDAAIFGSNQDTDAVYEFFRNLHVLGDDNTLNALVDILVVRTSDDIILFDTGVGGAPGGNLVPTLSALGIEAADVTIVACSHFHPDHISGLSSEGNLTFPNAQVFFPQPEYDFMQEAPAEMVGAAVAALQPAIDNDQVTFYNHNDEIVSGVLAVEAHGHSPGHMAFLLENNDNRLLHLVDAVLNAYAHVPNPTWHSRFDSNPEQAVETRTRLMTRAADGGVPVFGYHFPFPGIGFLSHEGEGFHYTPAAF